jgi:hypothetical protein
MSAPIRPYILNMEGLGTRYERWLKLEEKSSEKEIDLTAEQVAFIEKQTPASARDALSRGVPGSSLTRIPSSWGT